MTPFAERANTRLKSIKSDHAAAVTAFESLVAAFAEDPKKSNAEDFFGVFVDLIRSLEHACEANDRAAAVAARSGGGAGGGAGAGVDRSEGGRKPGGGLQGRGLPGMGGGAGAMQGELAAMLAKRGGGT